MNTCEDGMLDVFTYLDGIVNNNWKLLKFNGIRNPNILKKAYGIALSNSSSHNKYSLCAITFNGKGLPLSFGVNKTTTHPKQKELNVRAGRHGEGLHAEMHAVLRATGPVDTLLVLRVDRRGLLALAKPCKGCLIGIKEKGINTVIYSSGMWTFTKIVLR